MSRPNTTQEDRDALDDRGLAGIADETDDLRPKRSALGRCTNTAEGLQNHHQKIERKLQ